MSDTHASAKRRARLQKVAAVVVAVLLIPLLGLSVVGGYGISVWVYQIMAGPPGAPHR